MTCISKRRLPCVTPWPSLARESRQINERVATLSRAHPLQLAAGGWHNTTVRWGQRYSDAALLRSRRAITNGPWAPSFFEAYAPEFLPADRKTLDHLGYSSQLGQDAFLDRFVFGQKRHGTFVDIGAHDGRSLSNSWFFESEREWTGLCVEANPQVFDSLIRNRSCKCVNAAVTSTGRGSARFLLPEAPELSMLAGLERYYTRRHRKRLGDESRAIQSTTKAIDVSTVALDQLIDQFDLQAVDALMVDVEGGEYGVLQSANWDTFRPRAVLLESNYGSRRVTRFLRSRGYVLLARIAWDRVYVDADWTSASSSIR
jgi:FkbM family methyltransferase